MSNKPGYCIKVMHLMVLLVGLSLSGCSVQRQLAKKFVQKADNIAIMVLMPEHVYMVNQKTEDEIPAFFLSDTSDNPELLNETLLFSQFDEQQLITAFEQSFKTELSNYGCKVYGQNQMEEFMGIDSVLYIVHLAQMELMEFTTVVEDQISVGGEHYSTDIWLNGLNMAVWVELNMTNDTTAKPHILYADNNLYDSFTGYYTQKFFSGEIEYRLSVDTITTEGTMDFVHYLGRLYAAYTFDYILNTYLQRHLPDDIPTDKYFRYDPYRKLFFSTQNDRFIELE